MKDFLKFLGWGAALLVIWGLLSGSGQDASNVSPSTTSTTPLVSEYEVVQDEQDPASVIDEDVESDFDSTNDTPVSSGLSNDNYYINSQGNEVHSPAYSTDGSVPAGATAKCADGTYSFSQSRRGTCSHHGGVARWL